MAGMVIDLGKNYGQGAANYAQDPALEGRREDPASGVAGASPNFGQFAIPHVLSFTGTVSSLSRVYRESDEALKHSRDNARFMRNDLVIMECIEARQRATALLNCHVEPDDAKSAVQKELAGTLTKMINRIPRFMQYRENLLHAVYYGRYAIANRWRWQRFDNRPRIVVDRWRPVHGDKLVWRFAPDDARWDDDQIGVRVGYGWGGEGNTIAGRWPIEKAAQVAQTELGLAYFLRPWERSLLSVHKHYIEDGEFETPENAGRIHGVGIRSRIYWTWYQKQETLAWLMEYLERSAGGFEIWFYPWGNDAAKSAIETAARERASLGRNQLLVPKFLENDQFGQWYDRIEPSMAGADALKSIIMEYFGHLLKRYILGQTLTTESSGTGLGSNLADVHLATFLQIVKYDATNLEETLTTELLDHYIRFNVPWAVGIPFKVRIDTESENAHEKIEAMQKGWAMGLKIRAQDMYDIIGATKPQPDDETLDKGQQDQQAAAMGMTGATGMPGMPPQPGMPGQGPGIGPEPEGPPKMPVEQYALRTAVAQAAAATATPTEAQIEAGNYRKGKVRLRGLTVTIENPKGSSRKPEWPPLSAHYGYINRTEGRDGDHVDCYIGSQPESEVVFVIDQLTKGGRFDEHKCVLGTTSESQAKRLYLANYPPDWKCGPITALTVPQFRAWLEGGDTTKPIVTQVSRYSASGTFEFMHPRDEAGQFTEKSGGGGRSPARDLPGLPKLPERKTDFKMFGGDLDAAIAAAEKRGDVQYRSAKGQQSLFGDEDEAVDQEHLSHIERVHKAGKITSDQFDTAADWVSQHGHHPDWHLVRGGTLFDREWQLVGRVERAGETFAVQIDPGGEVSVYHWPGFGKSKKKRFATRPFPLSELGKGYEPPGMPGEKMLFSLSV